MLATLINYTVSSISNVLSVLYIIHIILNKNFDFKDYKKYIIVVLFIFGIAFNFFIEPSIRILFSTSFAIIATQLIYHDSINRTIAATVSEQLIFFISEIIFVIFITIFLGANGETMLNSYYGQIITSATIAIIALIIIQFPFVKKISSKLLKIADSLRIKNLASMAFIFIVAMNVLLIVVYREVNLLTILILNLSFMIIYGYILYTNMRDKSSMVQIKAENKALADNLDEYEKMLDHQRVTNHENKNQLLVIKNLLNENNQEALDYINEIIKDSKQENDVLFNRAKKIPSGGLQGLVYQKMLTMQEKNIKPILNVSNNVKKLKVSNDAKLNYDICRITGVFLDNAIDEVLKTKEKEIIISLYEQDNDLIIEVSNNFKDAPCLDRIDNKGYTTKGNGHGYGLSLVKEIVDSNSLLVNERNINGNIFTQILKIKM